jgi:metal-sulfur cluster biosynthetic enzyme
MDEAEYYIPANEWEPAAVLPQEWGGWEGGWKFFKRLDLLNTTSIVRENEPIEVDVEFHGSQVSDLASEIRVVEVASANGQVYGDVAEENTRRCRLFFLAHLQAKEKKTYLIFYGNPAAPPPAYETDLQVSGEGWGLDVENNYYRVGLAKSMGHLKRLAFKQGHAAFAAGGPPMTGGHGVEGSVHWNPDWSDEHTGRYRVTNWPEPPHYSVVRGPICLRLKRWGHPILALGPDVGGAQKVMASVTYTFYASVPYILMESRLEVLEDVRFGNCRNDEWLGMGGTMPEIAWMTKGGEIGFGAKHWARQNPAWMTYYNKENGDGFASLGLKYECTHADWHEPASVSIYDGLWVRYPLDGAVPTIMRAGDFVYEKNAYLLHRYEPPLDSGFGMLMDYYKRLSAPLVQEQAPRTAKPLIVRNVLDALGACYDTEVYIKGSHKAKRMLSIVDLGLVRKVEIAGDVVHIALVMPYAGRETWFGWYANMMEQQIRQRVEGVGQVKVELVRKPAWSPDQMALGARRLLGLPAGDGNSPQCALRRRLDQDVPGFPSATSVPPSVRIFTISRAVRHNILNFSARVLAT